MTTAAELLVSTVKKGGESVIYGNSWESEVIQEVEQKLAEYGNELPRQNIVDYWKEMETALQGKGTNYFSGTYGTNLAKHFAKLLYNTANWSGASYHGNTYSLKAEYMEVVLGFVRDEMTPLQILQFRGRLQSLATSLTGDEFKEAAMKLIVSEAVKITLSDQIFVDQTKLPDQRNVQMALAELLELSQTGLTTPNKFMLRTLGRYLIGLGMFILFNSGIVGYNAPAVIGPLPLHHIESMEVAFSGKVLKYRATGSVFLAQQIGAKDAVRVEGYFYKEKGMIWLFLIWMIFLYGRSTKMTADQNLNEMIGGLFTEGININPATTLSNLPSILSARKMTNILNFDKSKELPSWEHHNTFPFVTRHVIIPNCYIETYSFEDRVVDGKEVVKYTLLLRTYTKPESFDLFKVVGSNNRILSPKLRVRTNMLTVIGFSLNFIWRMVSAGGLIFDPRSYTLNMLNPLKNSIGSGTYYDIDGLDVATTFAIGFGGLL